MTQKEKREYGSTLTREMLEEMGITNVYWDEDNQEWWINRRWISKGKCKKATDKKVIVRMAKRDHKYVGPTYYPAVGFSYKGQFKSYSLSRFLWAWFKGEVKHGEVVDHIDNDHFNNRLENLRAMTIEENNQKRFEDHRNCTCFNQFYNSVNGKQPEKR